MTFRNLFISLIALTLIAISHSHAEIHLDDFAGVWLFDEGKGNIVKDLTDNGNDGEFDGPKWIDGKFGKALEFDGSPKYVIIEHNELFNEEARESQVFRLGGNLSQGKKSI